MFTMRKIHSCEGDGSYLNTYLSQNNNVGDYYGEKGNIGKWVGKLSDRLGIKIGDEIGKNNTAFRRLEKNLHPETGMKLTLRNKKDAVRFYDFTCSAEKTVSVMSVTMQDHRITGVHNRAVKTALEELERSACYKRKEKESREFPRVTGEIVAGIFQHDVSRALDPQLHTHCVVANVTWDPDNRRFTALESVQMVRAIRLAGKVYQNEMVKGLRNLGYETESRIENGKVTGFRIKGVSEEIAERFSKRRQVILAEIEKQEKEKNRPLTDEEVIKIVLETRAKKKKIDSGEILEYHRSQMTPEEIQQLAGLRAAADARRKGMGQTASNEERVKTEYKASEGAGIHPEHHADNREGASPGRRESAGSGPRESGGRTSPGYRRKTADEVIAKAAEILFERNSVVPSRELLAEALNQGLGDVSLEELRGVLEHSEEIMVIDRTRLIPDAETEVTTLAAAQEEKWCIEFVNGSRGTMMHGLNESFRPYSDPESREREANGKADFSKSRQIIENILKSRDRIQVLRGVAGAGKTTLLQELDRGVKLGGLQSSLYLSPTTTGAEILREEGFQATTLQSVLVQNGKPVEKGSFIVVDEASIQSNSMGAQLLKIAEEKDCRVLLVGDIRQHTSVEAGDFLRILETFSDVTRHELSEVRRQQVEEYRKAVEAMAAGDTVTGLQTLDEQGWIIEDAGYQERAVEYWWEFTGHGQDPDNTVLVAPSNDEVKSINELVRAKLKESGALGRSAEYERYESNHLTRGEKSLLKAYEPGTAIVFGRRTGNFETGRVYYVISIDEETGVVMTDNGRLDLKDCVSYDVGKTELSDIAVGDRLIITANCKDAGMKNGETVTVVEVGSDGVKCRNRHGREFHIPKEFFHCQRGYCVTSHRSQGLTRENVIVAGRYLDKKVAYVACSRGKQNIRVVCPDKKYLMGQLKDRERKAVMDTFKGKVLRVMDRYTRIMKGRESVYSQLKGRILSTAERWIQCFLNRNTARKQKSENVNDPHRRRAREGYTKGTSHREGQKMKM